MHRTQNRTNLPIVPGSFSGFVGGLEHPSALWWRGRRRGQGGTGRSLAPGAAADPRTTVTVAGPGQAVLSGPQWGRVSGPCRLLHALPAWSEPGREGRGPRPAARRLPLLYRLPAAWSRPGCPTSEGPGREPELPRAGFHFLGGCGQLCPRSPAGPARPGPVLSPARGCCLQHHASSSLPRARAASSWARRPGRGSLSSSGSHRTPRRGGPGGGAHRCPGGWCPTPCGGVPPLGRGCRVSCPRPRPGCGPGLQARWHRGPRRDASPCPLSMGHCSGGRRGAWGRAVWTRCPTDVPSLRPSQRTASPGAQCRRWAASGMAAGGSQPQSAGSAELGGCTAGRGHPMRPWGEAASAGVRRPRRQRGRSPPSTGSRPDPRRGPSPFSASAFRGAGSGPLLTLCGHRKLGLQANPEFQAESRLEPQPPFLLWRREV